MEEITNPETKGSAPRGDGGTQCRVVDALLSLCLEHGYPDVTLPMVLERAGVDSREFGLHYADIEDCFLKIYTGYRDDIMGRIAAAVAEEESWRGRIRAAAYTMLGYMEVDERRTNFIVIEVRRAGERAVVSMGEAFEEMFDLLDSGRDERGRTDISRATAEAVGGTIFFRMNAAFEQGSMEAVRAKMPEMMYMAVLPYLGAEAAEDELHAAPPAPSSESGG